MKDARENAEYIVNHYFPLEHRTEPEYSADVKEVSCVIRSVQIDALKWAFHVVQDGRIPKMGSSGDPDRRIAAKLKELEEGIN